MVNAPVSDVQVNGTSVVADGVADMPIIGNEINGVGKTVGMVRFKDGYCYGFKTFLNGNDYCLALKAATESGIKTGKVQNANGYGVIDSTNINSAAFYGLAKAAGDTTQSASSNAVGTYTDPAKSAIHEMLNGPVTVSGTTPIITALPGIQYVCGEVATLDITLPASGCVDVVFESGSTPTVLTITPQTGMTAEWANGFDSTALEADTLYELNIKMVGTKCLGVAGAWT